MVLGLTKTWLVRIISVTTLQLLSFVVTAQIAPDELNPAFQLPPLSDTARTVNAVAVVNNETQIIAAGRFDYIGDVSVTNIARLNLSDGSVDTSFKTRIEFDEPTSIQSTVNAVQVLSNGKVLVAGNFTSVDGVPRRGIARLNGDGSLDTTFEPPVLSNDFDTPSIITLLLQSDGKILMVDQNIFRNVDGQSIRSHVIRLNADGSFDPSFTETITTGGAPFSAALQSDDKILLGGSFSGVNDAGFGAPSLPRVRLARLNADGSLDESYDAPVNSVVFSIEIDSDDAAYITGPFNTVDSTARSGLAKISSTGELSSSFNPVTNSAPQRVKVLTNTKVAVAQQSGFTIFNADGTLFEELPLSGPRVNDAIEFSNGNLLLAGRPQPDFQSSFNDFIVFDASFDLVESFDVEKITGPGGSVDAIQAQTNKILIRGQFQRIGGVPRAGFARINADGSLDSSFDPIPETVSRFDVLSSGKFYASGGVTSSDSFRLARFNQDGSFDASFAINPSPKDGPILALKALSDGSVLAGLGELERFLPDGTKDDGFSVVVTLGPNPGGVSKILQEPNGKLVIVGRFEEVNGQAISHMARLMPDGSLDPSFNNPMIVAPGFTPSVSTVARQRDGKYLIGGPFSQVGGQERKSLARVNANGGVDASYNPRVSGSRVTSIMVLPDQSAVITGSIRSVSDVARKNIAHINVNGSLAADFSMPLEGGSPNSTIRTGDGRLFVGGNFTRYGNVEQGFLIQLGQAQEEELCTAIKAANGKVISFCL